MQLTEVLGNLCVLDPRNPHHFDVFDFEVTNGCPIPFPRETGLCRCGNCFHGRDRLALEIMRLLEENEAMDKTINSLV